MSVTIPGVDLPATTSSWTEQQRDLYHKLDYFMVKSQIPRFRQTLIWQKLLKPIKWQANQGPEMRSVVKVPSPHLRSKFFPNPLSAIPKKDIVQVLETEEACQLHRHYFDSLVFQFLPSFEDFLTDCIEAHNKDITEKIARSHDLFVRTAMFEAAPHLWVAGSDAGLNVTVPYTKTSTNTEVKTAAFIKSQLTKVGPLNLVTLSRIASAAEFDLGIPCFSGDNLGDGTDGKALAGKYVLITSSELWFNLPFDPFLKENRPLDLNIVTDGFTGSLWGRITAKFEQFPLRFDANGNAPAPEASVNDPESPMNGLTVPNPAYVQAPFEVAWLMGAEAFKSVSVGPPPAPFSSGSMDYDKFKAMDWNGKVSMTRNIMVPTIVNNVVVNEPNTRGEYMKLVASAIYGIMPVNRRNVLPIIFKRQRAGGAA